MAILSLVFFTTTMIIGTPTSVVAQTNSTAVNNVFPIQSKPYGKSYGEWSAQW